MITGLTDHHWKIISKCVQAAMLNGQLGVEDIQPAKEIIAALGLEGIIPAGPTRITECKYCGAPIAFAKRANGWIALEPTPLEALEQTRSTKYTVDWSNSRGGRGPLALVKKPGNPGPRYISHTPVCGARETDKVPQELMNRYRKNREVFQGHFNQTLTELRQIRDSMRPTD